MGTLLGLAVPAAFLAGCNTEQSAFSVFGAEAESLRTLTFIMVGAAAVITVAVLALARHAVHSDAGIGYRGGLRVILWLGGVVPTLVLTALLVGSLPRMQPLEASEGDLTIAIDGEQFWWRVAYDTAEGEAIVSANEIRLPVGRPVRFSLQSPDVIHSFWIPGLAGKVDLIPGRTNELIVRATRTGVFRGVCAEFCGLSHAHMAFDVLAMEPEAFDRWLAAFAAASADTGAPGGSAPGGRLFEAYGCAGCHAVRGHFAGTAIGPDLTQFGARQSVGAATLPMTLDTVAAFILDAPSIKPGARMPAFTTMPRDDAEAIAAWLVGLAE